jgi:hypothetical protein
MGIDMEGIDMPFTKYGIRPDIIMNPNAIPSRMTIGQLWECLVGKIGALKGMNMDGTPFEDYDIESMETILESLGYQKKGEEYMYNGMTGKKIKNMIFIGPTYYQRLKHMVQDKIHCLTADHQVLTERGWVQIDAIMNNDKIAVPNNSSNMNELQYVYPIDILKFPEARRKIITVLYADGTIMQRVTENHRMYVSMNGSNDKEAKFELIEASELLNDINGILKCECMLSGDNKIIPGPFKYYEEFTNAMVYCLTIHRERFIVRNTLTNAIAESGFITGNSRARGPVTILTRSAPEGRSRDGGLRLGESSRPKVTITTRC